MSISVSSKLHVVAERIFDVDKAFDTIYSQTLDVKVTIYFL
jgi:hypothetical protein